MAHYGLEIFAHEKVRCPFHGEDRKPSATIRNNHFYCYTCNESFDVFGFIKEMERCTFPEALRIAANIAGLALPDNSVASRKDVARLAKAIAERKHYAEEQQRVAMSSEQKYSVLSGIARIARSSAPDWLAKLDVLLETWLHGVPDEVDLRPLLALMRREQLLAAGPFVERLHAEQEWVTHE